MDDKQKRKNLLILASSSPRVILKIETIKDAGYSVERYPSLADIISSSKLYQPCIVVVEIGALEDLNRAHEFLEATESFSVSSLRTIIYSVVKVDRLRERLARFSVADYIDGPVPERTVAFKLELQQKILDQSDLEKKIEPAFRIQTVSQATDGSVVLKVRGPTPQKGSWLLEPNAPESKIRWRWIKNSIIAPDAEKNNDEVFLFTGEQAPKFDEKENIWILQAKEPVLEHQVGEKVAYSSAETAWSMRERKQKAEGNPAREKLAAKPKETHENEAKAVKEVDRAKEKKPELEKKLSALEAKQTAENGLLLPAQARFNSTEGSHSPAEDTKVLPDERAYKTKQKGINEEKNVVSRKPMPIEEDALPQAAKESSQGKSETAKSFPDSISAIDLLKKIQLEKAEKEEKINTGAEVSEKLQNKEALQKKGPSVDFTAQAQKNKNRPSVELSESSAPKSARTQAESLEESFQKRERPIVPEEIVAIEEHSKRTKTPAISQEKEKVLKDTVVPDSLLNQAAGKRFLGEIASLKETNVLEDPEKVQSMVSAAKSNEVPNLERKIGQEMVSAAGAARLGLGTAENQRTEIIQEQVSSPANPDIQNIDVVPLRADQGISKVFVQGERIAERDRSIVRERASEQVFTPNNPSAVKRRYFIKTMQELRDRNSTWERVDIYRIYIAGEHKYYGIKDLKDVLPLWIYPGESAPEYIELKRSWLFYDQLPFEIYTEIDIPAPVQNYLLSLIKTASEREATSSGEEQKISLEESPKKSDTNSVKEGTLFGVGTTSSSQKTLDIDKERMEKKTSKVVRAVVRILNWFRF